MWPMGWGMGPPVPPHETVDSLAKKHVPTEGKKFWLSVTRDPSEAQGDKPGTMSVEDAEFRPESDAGDTFKAVGYYNDGDSRQRVEVEGTRRVIESVPIDAGK